MEYNIEVETVKLSDFAENIACLLILHGFQPHLLNFFSTNSRFTKLTTPHLMCKYETLLSKWWKG